MHEQVLPSSVKSNFKIICSKGHVFTSTFDALKNKNKQCTVCSGRHKKTETHYQELAKSHGFKWIGSTIPDKVIDKTMWMCLEHGHTFESSYNKIKNGAKCKVCIGYGKKSLLDYQIVADKAGLEFIGKVPSITRIPTEWKCLECGYKITASFDNVNRGTGCKSCAGLVKKNLSDYHNLATSLGFKFIGEHIPDRTVIKTSWLCDKGHEFISSYHNLVHNKVCNICSHSTSKKENEILDYIKSLGFKAEKRVFTFTDKEKEERSLDINKKYKYEIDIFIPELNIGIEYHGLYFHSYGFIELNKQSNKHDGRTMHRNKYRFFKARGIDLIQIFSSEWESKQDIVKSIINSRLGIAKKIYARKCSIKKIAHNDVSMFLNNNHIQGGCPSKYNYALIYEGYIVSVMTFNQSRFEKNKMELVRFANKLNISVVGGFSKLLKHFISESKTKNIVSYCNLRYFSGSGYIKNGFKPITYTQPNYFYFKNNSSFLYSRHKFQKHKLQKELDIFDASLSEYENMKNNGYEKIYDAGNLKLIYSIE